MYRPRKSQREKEQASEEKGEVYRGVASQRLGRPQEPERQVGAHLEDTAGQRAQRDEKQIARKQVEESCS